MAEQGSRQDKYACQVCLTGGVKLWRLGGIRNGNVVLMCAGCAGWHQGVDVREITPDGQVRHPRSASRMTHNIGDYVPAVPSPDGYWGVTCIPADALTWWSGLPNEEG